MTTSWQRNGSMRSASRLLEVVQRRKQLTVKEMTEATGLSRGTVTNLVDQLVNLNVLTKSAGPGDHVGRRPQVISLGRAAGVLVGVELGFYAIAIAVEPPDGPMLEIRVPYDHRIVENPFSKTLGEAVDLAADALRDAGIGGTEIRGIGLAIPAPVDHTTGTVLSRDALRGWPPIAPHDEFASQLASALGIRDAIPALLGNDAQLGAWGTYCSRTAPEPAELVPGRGTAGRNKLMFIKASEAIRVGFVNNGAPDWGCSFPSGDFSHQAVQLGAA
ncbi:MAG TPA: MarR family transcriptional regulator, partial [Actinomycetota bacterium]|nr:MarR family transcriptional regulator [Actinomycetota bacterium]